MISETYNENVFIADFTDYVGKPGSNPVSYKGVVVDTKDNGIIPSFEIHDEHHCPFVVVNNECYHWGQAPVIAGDCTSLLFLQQKVC